MTGTTIRSERQFGSSDLGMSDIWLLRRSRETPICHMSMWRKPMGEPQGLSRGTILTPLQA